MKSPYQSFNSLPRTNKLVLTSFFLALVTISTSIVKIPTPFTSGYIHLGDGLVLISGLFLGPYYGALAGGLGSALADMIGGYPHWIIPTLLIKGLMAYIVGHFSKEDQLSLIKKSLAFFIIVWLGFLFTTYALLSSYSKNLNIRGLEPLKDYISSEMSHEQIISQLNSVKFKLILMGLIVTGLIVALYFLMQKFNLIKIPLQFSLAFIFSGLSMVLLYYLAYYIMTGNYISPIISIPSNLIQFSIGFIVAQVLSPLILPAYMNINSKHNKKLSCV